MKVIVTRRDKNRVVKADMEREIERLFQENKDLRVHVGHLRDELNLAQQRSEARRQVICERDKTIQELNEELAKSESDYFSQGMNAIVKFWEEAVNEKNKVEERAEEYHIALMESDCRIAELEKQLEWARNKNEEWAQITATQKEEEKALEDIIHAFKETSKEYEEEIHAQHVEKREWMQKYEELKAQKEADDKKSEEICTACNERYEEVLSERNHLRAEVVRLTKERNDRNARIDELEKRIEWLQNERQLYENNVARLTNERDTVVNESAELIFKINELRDRWEAEHNLHAVANKRLEELQEEHNELETDYDALAKTKREYAEEIDRLRKVVIELQTNRFTYDEFIGMIMKNFMPSTDK